jgi:hypothetical protein
MAEEFGSALPSVVATVDVRDACASEFCVRDHEEIPRPELVLSERVHNPEYHRGPISREMYVPAV